mgnify:CR=1 FL=1
MPTRSVELIRHPLRVRTLEVRAVKRPGPLYQLITLGGDDLAEDGAGEVKEGKGFKIEIKRKGQDEEDE